MSIIIGLLTIAAVLATGCAVSAIRQAIEEHEERALRAKALGRHVPVKSKAHNRGWR